MRRNKIVFCSLLSLIVLGTVTSSVRAQEKYQLQEKSAVGDVNQTDDEFNMNLTIKATAAGQPDQTFVTISKEHSKYKQETLLVNGEGRPDALRRTYSLWHSYEKNPDGEKTKDSTLLGKTVTIKRKGEQVLTTAEGATVPEEDRKTLVDALDNKKGHFFPGHALAVGEEWTADAASLAKSFPGATKVSLQGKLMDIVSVQGHKCAHLHMSLDLVTPLGNGLSMEMKLEGEGYQALDIQRPLSIALSGPVTASGKTTSNGIDIDFSGEGTAQMKLAVEWQKVAGKSVAKTGAP